jgi:hypothetical protein
MNAMAQAQHRRKCLECKCQCWLHMPPKLVRRKSMSDMSATSRSSTAAAPSQKSARRASLTKGSAQEGKPKGGDPEAKKPRVAKIYDELFGKHVSCKHLLPEMQAPLGTCSRSTCPAGRTSPEAAVACALLPMIRLRLARALACHHCSIVTLVRLWPLARHS